MPVDINHLLEQMREIDPSLDLRPGSSARALVEAIASQAVQVQDALEQYAQQLTPDPFRREYMGRPMGEYMGREHDLAMPLQSNPGRHVHLPPMPLHSNPTITIDEIRSRRFNLIDRYDSKEPEAPKEMNRDEMERVALLIKKTIWDRIIEDD